MSSIRKIKRQEPKLEDQHETQKELSKAGAEAWLQANPDFIDEARRGFDEIKAGKFRRISRETTK